MRLCRPGGFLLVLGLSLLAWSTSDAPPRPIYAVDSVAEMQAADGRKTPMLQVLGYYPGSLQGGGLFVWRSSDKAPDNCTVFADAAGNGRWLRRLTNSVLDVTMCGAKWDSVSDDAPAFNAAFAVASANGFSLSCPGGTGRIAGTVAPKRFENVVLRCQGMAASTLSCVVEARPCFLFQNPVGSAAPQAPQIYDLNIVASRPQHRDPV